MAKPRPLSPHLQVYDMLQMTTVLSIFHRGTGAFLAISFPLLIVWLWAIAYSPESYASLQTCAGTIVGRLALLGWTFSIFYHLSNGIRHLFWDIGKGFEMGTLRKSGMLVVASATILTIATWVVAYNKLGGLA